MTDLLFVFISQLCVSATAITVTAVAYDSLDTSNRIEQSPRKRQERVRSSGLAAGYRQRVTVDEPLIPIDRIAPMGTGGTPITGNTSEVSIGFADATSETLCRSSVFFFAVPDKDFYDRSLTYRLTAVHEPRQ